MVSLSNHRRFRYNSPFLRQAQDQAQGDVLSVHT